MSYKVLYASRPPAQQGHLLATTSALKSSEEGDNPVECSVQIYEHCLAESSSMGKLFIHFEFEVKYEYRSTPPAFIFEREGEKWRYVVSSKQDAEAWREALKVRLNQRGFH